ncbi:MAG TPA: DUF4926 domain-containing protein [Chloroflexia bacterium]|jgi:hypothetical protein
MKDDINLLDVVAVLEDMPDKGIQRGQVGTVVELLTDGVHEVEFSDDEGRTYATVALSIDKLMVLHYGPVEVA